MRSFFKPSARVEKVVMDNLWSFSFDSPNSMVSCHILVWFLVYCTNFCHFFYKIEGCFCHFFYEWRAAWKFTCFFAHSCHLTPPKKTLVITKKLMEGLYGDVGTGFIEKRGTRWKVCGSENVQIVVLCMICLGVTDYNKCVQCIVFEYICCVWQKYIWWIQSLREAD